MGDPSTVDQVGRLTFALRWRVEVRERDPSRAGGGAWAAGVTIIAVIEEQQSVGLISKKARLAMAKQAWDEAQECYDQLIRLQPTRVKWRRAAVDLVKVRFDKREDVEEVYECAKAEFARRVELAPEDPMAHFDLGYAWVMLTASFALATEELAAAEAAFKQAIRISPELRAGYAGMKILYNKRSIAGHHCYLEAIDVARTAVDRNYEDPEAWCDLGDAFNENYDVNMKQDALHAFQWAVKLDPNMTEAYFKIASIQRILSVDDDSAISSYERVIELEPDSDWAKMARRSLEHMRGGPSGPRPSGAAMPVPGYVPQFRDFTPQSQQQIIRLVNKPSGGGNEEGPE